MAKRTSDIQEKIFKKSKVSRLLIRLLDGAQAAGEHQEDVAGTRLSVLFRIMKTKTLFFVSLTGVTLAAGAILSQGCPRIATEAEVPTPTAVAGPLRHLPAATVGRVWEVYVQTGSRVKRGQVLAKLVAPLHTVGQQQAETDVQSTKQRYSQLLSAESGQVSAQVLAQAREQLVAANLKLAGAPKQVTFVFLQAPVDGVVARVPAPAGTYVSDSSTVVSLGSARAATFEVADN